MYSRIITLFVLMAVWIPQVFMQSTPEDKTILFQSVSADTESSSDLYTASDNVTEIEPLTELGVAYYPTWLSDGSSILFVEDGIENDRIVLLNADDNTMTEVISSDDEKLLEKNVLGLSYPVMSPDAKFLAFVAAVEDQQNASDIYLLDMQSGELSLLTDNNAIEKDLQFSQDSSRLLFLSDLDNEDEFFTYRIHVIEIPSQTELIIPNPFPSDPVSPRWSSDDNIVFASSVESWRLYTVDLLNLEANLYYTGELLDFGNIQAFDIDIATEKIVLSGCSSSPSSCEIYVVDIGEATVLQITNNEVLDAFPSWQPIVLDT